MKYGLDHPYKVKPIIARCGCLFLVGETAVSLEVEPGVFETVARIPELEPPETPTVWAHEHVLDPHADECLAMREPSDGQD